jgi:Holliday junction resolvasome RuvABC ATP-dependent DNA helicase subunit
MVERPSEVTEILELLKQGNKVGVVGRHGGDVGIRGMGGLGKTVLAQAVAWEVSKSRQVVWLDIGQTPDRLKLINTLVGVLGGDVSFSDIVAAKSWLQENTVCMVCYVFENDDYLNIVFLTAWHH